MTPDAEPEIRTERFPRAAAFAALVSLIGLADSIYLTVHHFTAEPVPCSIIEGCEQVLTSRFAEIGGIPLAAFGAGAYFAAFSLALLTVFGNAAAWKLFGVVATLMAVFSLWLIYVQGAVIGAFCQFCLLSAISSILLAAIYWGAKLMAGRSRQDR